MPRLSTDVITHPIHLPVVAHCGICMNQILVTAVGDSMGCDILAKLGQDAYASHPSLPPDVDKSANVPDIIGANKIGHVQGDVEAVWSKKNNEAVCAQEAHARPQQESIKGAVIGKVRDTPEAMEKATTSRSTGQSSPYSTESHCVSASKHSLMARDPRASTYEVFSMRFFCCAAYQMSPINPVAHEL
jgi:hypothetical protein